MNLWNWLVYTKILSNREKSLNFWNISYKVKDQISPVFIWNKLIEKRIFEIGKKNKVIFSLNRDKIIFDLININWFLKIFDIYKRISFDEKKIIYTLPQYTVKNINELNSILQQFWIDFVKFDSYLGKDLIALFDINIEESNDLNFLMSLLLAAFLFYGDFVVKDNKFISLKIYWPLINLDIKKYLDYLLQVFAKNFLCIYSYFIQWKNSIYQWIIEDWEIMENILSLLKLDYINYQEDLNNFYIDTFCEKYNCNTFKNKFLWKVVEYK